MTAPAHVVGGTPTPSRPRVTARVTSFGRTGGQVDAAFARVLASHGALLIEPERGESFTSVAPGWVLDAVSAFGRSAPLVVEVGSGAGEQVVRAAAAHPERDFLALEVWTDGIAATARRAAETGVTNLRVLRADAHQVFAGALPSGSVAEVWTFFPDPWRKSRHHKRRLVNPAFADDVARALTPGGCWRLATDWEDYAGQVRDVLSACTLLESGPEWAPRWDGRVLTRFERKAAEAGRVVRDVAAVRRCDA